MLVSDIITKFELYVDDSTELSSIEELSLCQKIYNKIWTDRPWEFAKRSATGTFSTTLPYVPLPADFGSLTENNQSTDNSVGVDNNGAPKVVYVGSSYTPYQIVNWSDRRTYFNKNGFAYLDIPNSRLVFTVQPLTADTYEFDYLAIPDTLTTASTPAFPARYHEMIYHGMAADHDIILLFPRASSYAPENIAKYNSYLQDMAMWNANLSAN